MRVCIDLTALDDNFSGIERYAACLAEEMIKDNSVDYVLLFKNSIHPMFQSYMNYSNVEVYNIKGCKKLLFNQIKLPFFVQRIKADYYLFLAFPVPVLLFKKNMISTIHDICCWDCPETMNGLSKWYFRISHKIAMKKCKSIITISKFSKDRIIEKLNYPEEKIWLVYCGIDNKLLQFHKDMEQFNFIRKKYDLPDKYFLSLCTLEPRKNLRLLIDAYARYYNETEKALPLVLAGRRGWKIESLLDGIDANILKNIFFTGFVDDQDLPSIYGNANCFIFPSKYEGFGMPPLEALACGTNVISSNSSSLPEVLGNAAIYFENDDVDSLVRIMNNYSMFEINENNRTERMRKFNWSFEAKKLLQYMRGK